jgi:hypothetical protein
MPNCEALVSGETGGPHVVLIQYRNRQGRSRRLTIGNFGRLTPTRLAVKRGSFSAMSNEASTLQNNGWRRGTQSPSATCAVSIWRKPMPGSSSAARGYPEGQHARNRPRADRPPHHPATWEKTAQDLASADVKRFLEAVTSGKTAATVKTKPRGLARVTGGPTAAVRAVGLLGGMLTYAKEVGYIAHNPAHGIRKPADKRRSFRLAPEEYRALGQALEAAERKGEHWQAPGAIRMIALTGCRRSES